MPILDHPVDHQALGASADHRRQRISPRRLKPGKDDHRLQKRSFSQRVPTNDAGDQWIELHIKTGEAPKVSDGKMTEHASAAQDHKPIRTANGRELTRTKAR
jgi:hypothetical protein